MEDNPVMALQRILDKLQGVDVSALWQVAVSGDVFDVGDTCNIHDGMEEIFSGATPYVSTNQLIVRASCLLSGIKKYVSGEEGVMFPIAKDRYDPVDSFVTSFLKRSPKEPFLIEQRTVFSLFILDFVSLLEEDEYFRLTMTWIKMIGEDLSTEDLYGSDEYIDFIIKVGGQVLSHRPFIESVNVSSFLQALIHVVLITSCKRPFVIRALLGPFLKASRRQGSLPLNAEQTVWDVATVKISNDAPCGSLLSCLTVQQLFEDSSELLNSVIGGESYWNVVISYLLHADSVVRKRGAYLIEIFLKTYDEKHNIMTSTKEDKKISRVPSKRRGKKKRLNSSSNGRQDPLESESMGLKHESLPCSTTIEDTVTSQRSNANITSGHWLSEFLAIYAQLDGCRYIHLIDQVFGHVKNICRMWYEASTLSLEPPDGSIGEMLYPQLSFKWLEVLFRCLLNCELIAVRKNTLTMILSGDLPFYASSDSIRWVCCDLLSILDSPDLFPPRFGDSDRNPEYPGSLLPVFLENLLTNCVAVKNTDLFENLIIGIVRSVCGGVNVASIASTNKKTPPLLTSLTTCKWTMCVFSFSRVQSLLMDARPCLSGVHLDLLKVFLQERIASVNNIILNQILSGILPLFICLLDPVIIGPPSLIPREKFMCNDLNFLSLMYRFNMLDFCISKLRSLLREAFVRWSGSLLVPDPNASYREMTLNPLHSLEYCIAASVLYTGPRPSPSTNLPLLLASFNECVPLQSSMVFFVQGVDKLYSNPYMSLSEQQCAVWFLRGIFLILNGTELGDWEGSDNRWFVESVILCLGKGGTLSDIALYCVFVIKDVLSRGLQDCFDSTVPSGCTLSLEFATVCCSILSNLVSVRSMEVICASLSEQQSILRTELSTLDILCTFLEDSNIQRTSMFLVVLQWSQILMSGLSESVVSPDRLFEIDENLLSVVARVCRGIYEVAMVSSEQFRCDALRTRDNFDCTDITVALLSELLLQCGGVYGKFSSQWIYSKWCTIKNCIATILFCQSKPSFESQKQFMVDILCDIRDSVDSFPLSALPDVISCCHVAVRAILRFCKDDLQHGDCFLTVCERDLLKDIIEAVWRASLKSGPLHVPTVFTFCKVVFDPVILSYAESYPLVEYFRQLVSIGMARRPHILQNVVLQLYFTCKSKPELCIPFLCEFRKLLVYKDFVTDEYQTVQPGDFSPISEKEICDPQLCGVIPVTRIVLLQFLEEVNPDDFPNIQLGLNSLIFDLLGLNFEEDYLKSLPLGSEKYGEKLRAWQALCILSKHVKAEIASNVIDLTFKSLKQSTAHSIRVHIEIFLASLLSHFPLLVIPQLLSELENYNHSQQVLGSLFITIGHSTESICFYKSTEGEHYIERILKAIYPWLLCSPGLPRTITQLIFYRLVPLLCNTALKSSYDVLWSFLNTNIETVRMRTRQERFFRENTYQEKCTLLGLLSWKKEGSKSSLMSGVVYVDSPVDVIPVHLLTIITDHLKLHADTSGLVPDAPPMDTAGRDISQKALGVLQTKRIPLEDLQISLQDGYDGSSRSVAAAKRQEVIVFASLVSKATNLGGLARTCEIFAAEKLVLADLSIVHGDVFQGLAVSAGSWLPMEEVSEINAKSYLEQCKNCGYTIVGLEQTDSSASLLDCVLPSKCVLLLGKEREGIPVELLNVVDMCIEIPQFGVTRSLNVHVSASLALWEITAQNTKFLELSQVEN